MIHRPAKLGEKSPKIMLGRVTLSGLMRCCSEAAGGRRFVFPEFVFVERGEAALWVERSCTEQKFLDRLADADSFFADNGCHMVKDQRKIKVGRLTVAIAGQPRTIYVKRYNAFSLRYKLLSRFSRSGAFRALQGAAILRAGQIPTVAPVAAVEHRRAGILSKSFFITREISGGKTADVYWRHDLAGVSGRAGFKSRRRFLAKLAALFASLHRQQIYHNDLKDANILVAVGAPGENDPQLFLVDLEGVKRCRAMSLKRKVKNLVQLNRTLGRDLRAGEKLYFLKSYLDRGFAARQVRRQWIDSVVEESQRLDALKARIAARVNKHD